MGFRFLLLMVFCLGYLHGANTNSDDQKKVIKQAYINITSNVVGAEIYLDKELIGLTPIKKYKITPNKDLILKAVADKNFYKEDIIKTVNIKVTTIPTIEFNFEKAKGEVFLVGEGGDLYINGKFKKVLHGENRVFKVDADKNVSFRIRNGYNEGIFYHDIYANSYNEIKYKLTKIPLDERLYTQIINNEMWEDTKEAANTPIDWEEAKKYCENFSVGGYEDWELPTIGQLNNLHQNHKDEIYNGFGGLFYWSKNTSEDEKNIWQYAEVLNVERDEIEKSVQEIKTGRVRCVRVLDRNLPIPTIPQKSEESVEMYDKNITKDLDKFLLK